MSWSSLGDGRGGDDLGRKLSPGAVELGTGYILSLFPSSKEGVLGLSTKSSVLRILLFLESRSSDNLSTLGAGYGKAHKRQQVLQLPLLACWPSGSFSRAASMKLLHLPV